MPGSNKLGGAGAAGVQWTGGLFVRHEGGFEVVMRALNHYNRRLRRISESPELGSAGAMLASVLQSESAKTAPKLKELAARMRASLTDDAALASLENDLDLAGRAMSCYASDLRRAAAGDEFCASLLKDADEPGAVEAALEKLKGYC